MGTRIIHAPLRLTNRFQHESVWRDALTILAGALLLTLPAMLQDEKLHDSFWINFVWADQFNMLLASGDLYPRWLPLSHAGLGSPVFYYYPPGAFYLSGVLGLLGISTYATIIGAFCLGFALSGFAMYWWLKGWSAHPLAGALLFMGAPYHILDFYGRGAIAEFVAIGFIPLVALGVRRAAERKGIATLALSYAALIFTHLPLALLTSLFLIAPYSLALARKDVRRLLPVALAGSLGLALAGLYLLPALGLGAYRDSAVLWNSENLRPETWTFIWSQPPPTHPLLTLTIKLIVAALGILALVLAWVRRCGWALYGAGVAALVAGLVPGLWDLPLVRSVQFPFRALPIAEFALVTSLARHAISPRLFLGAVPAVVLSICLVFANHPRPDPDHAASVARFYPDVPENLPPGERPHSWPSSWAQDVARSTTRSERAGIVTERTFYFPNWRVSCAGRDVPTFPAAGTQLLSYHGDLACKVDQVWTSEEKAGGAISLIALLLILGVALLQRSNRYRVSFL